MAWARGWHDLLSTHLDASPIYTGHHRETETQRRGSFWDSFLYRRVSTADGVGVADVGAGDPMPGAGAGSVALFPDDGVVLLHGDMACGSPRSAAVKTLRDTPGGGWLRGEQVGYVENFGSFPSTARGERPCAGAAYSGPRAVLCRPTRECRAMCPSQGLYISLSLSFWMAQSIHLRGPSWFTPPEWTSWCHNLL